MKAKLLKKIRSRFKVHYYENRVVDKYLITDEDKGYNSFYIYDKHRGHATLEEALRTILYLVKKEYYKYSRKYKQSQIHTKVWYK